MPIDFWLKLSSKNIWTLLPLLLQAWFQPFVLWQWRSQTPSMEGLLQNCRPTLNKASWFSSRIHCHLLPTYRKLYMVPPTSGRRHLNGFSRSCPRWVTTPIFYQICGTCTKENCLLSSAIQKSSIILKKNLMLFTWRILTTPHLTLLPSAPSKTT